MFLHILKYELKNGLRNKDLIIWLVLFPIVLGTFFKVAFGNIYEKDNKFNAIPVAVVEVKENAAFRQVIEGIESADEPFLKVSYTDDEKAKKLLEHGDVEGIIYTDDKLRLTVKEKGVQESILKLFIEQYTIREKIVIDAMKESPEKAQKVIALLSEETAESCREIPLTQGNPDVYIQYFYNLIAMVAMFGCITGMQVTIQNQANLSPLGARNNCSPTPKSISISAGLAGSIVLQTLCMLWCVTFLAFVLKVDFGDRLYLVYPSAVLGGITGVTFGFFVGSVNKLSEKVKTAIIMSVIMFLCFCSGLMVGNIKGIISEKLPWFNNINPVAVISDCFYCLNLYEDYDRFITKLVTMLVISFSFAFLGFVSSRRKKYANI